MRRSRWCGILCSLLICSIVLMGLDLAFLGGKVSASTREKLAAPPKEGMSVSVSTNTNANGSLRFGLKLSGCCANCWKRSHQRNVRWFSLTNFRGWTRRVRALSLPLSTSGTGGLPRNRICCSLYAVPPLLG